MSSNVVRLHSDTTDTELRALGFERDDLGGWRLAADCEVLLARTPASMSARSEETGEEPEEPRQGPPQRRRGPPQRRRGPPMRRESPETATQ